MNAGLLFVLSPGFCGHAFAAEFNIRNENGEFYLEMCKGTKCTLKHLPYFEKPDLQLRDLNADGIPEIIVTDIGLTGGVVNICSLLYRIEDKNIELIQTGNNGSNICNISFHGEKIVSSYRDAASWFEDVYSYKAGRLIKELQDKNGVSRTIYDKYGKAIDKFILSGEDKKWWERSKRRAKVIVEKAVLYNSPSFHDESKMYLVKGDSVLLKEFSYNTDSKFETLFYKIEYITAKNKVIYKWIPEHDISSD
jgi:hypothetical protein